MHNQLLSVPILFFTHFSDQYIYLSAFSTAFLESLAFVGVFFPGATITFFLGFLVFKGKASFLSVVLYIALGAFVGDLLSYYLGTKGTRFFEYEGYLLKKAHLERGKKFFNKYGGSSIFLGRFIGVFRPIIPFIAGLSGMGKKSFVYWDALSCVIFAFFYIGAGYMSGRAWKTVARASERAFVVIFVIALLLATIYGLYKLLGRKRKMVQ